MQSPAHAAFSLSVSSVLCAFSDINVLGSVDYICIVLFASQLPDIDHPRSAIGRVFFPVSRYLSRHFGHRTITHSALAVVAVYIFSVLMQIAFFPDYHFAGLVTLSYGLHVFLDMMTIQGVPLAYPFKSNAFVLPGKASYRLTTGLAAHEFGVIVFSACSFLFLQDFIAKGFWTSYNETFGTVEHLSREYRRSENLLQCSFRTKDFSEYDYHSGVVLYVDSREMVLLDSGRIERFDLGSEIIDDMSFSATELRARSETIGLRDVTLDSLQSICDSRIVVTMSLISDDEILGAADHRAFKSSSVSLDYPADVEWLKIPENNYLSAEVLVVQ